MQFDQELWSSMFPKKTFKGIRLIVKVFKYWKTWDCDPVFEEKWGVDIWDMLEEVDLKLKENKK
jgi:hypothetical protein